MNNLNSVLVEGNLVRDPLVKQTKNGKSVCVLKLASSRYYKGQGGFEKEVSFFDIEIWGELAKRCENVGRKGRGVRVVGRLRQDRWNGEDGKLHTRIVIVAEHVEFRPEFRKQQKEAASADIENYTEEEIADFAEYDGCEDFQPVDDLAVEVEAEVE